MKLIELLESSEDQLWPSLKTAMSIVREHGLVPKALLDVAVRIFFGTDHEIRIESMSEKTPIYTILHVSHGRGSAKLRLNGSLTYTKKELGEALEKLKEIFKSDRTYDVRVVSKLSTNDLHPDLELNDDSWSDAEPNDKWKPTAGRILFYFKEIDDAYRVASAADDVWTRVDEQTSYPMYFRRKT